MVGNRTGTLYRQHELAIRTLYAEVKDRASSVGELLAGTPGTLVKRGGTGYEYWYRSFYPLPKKRCEDFVGAVDDQATHDAMLDRISHASWTATQVSALAKLGYQVADKGVASVLVELHNREVFDAGLTVVGTLAYMAWLNEYGVMASAARTQDIDLARRQTLKLGTPLSFLSTMQATRLPFAPVPGMPSNSPSTSVKLPGAEGLRVDILAPGGSLGKTVSMPELAWHAQAIPFYDYLLEERRPAAMLAGGHCVPIMLPDATRLIWHKLYASAQSTRSPAKAAKDLLQAATLASILVEQDGVSLRESYRGAPQKIRSAVRSRLPRIQALLREHPQAWDGFQAAQ